MTCLSDQRPGSATGWHTRLTQVKSRGALLICHRIRNQILKPCQENRFISPDHACVSRCLVTLRLPRSRLFSTHHANPNRCALALRSRRHWPCSQRPSATYFCTPRSSTVLQTSGRIAKCLFWAHGRFESRGNMRQKHSACQAALGSADERYLWLLERRRCRKNAQEVSSTGRCHQPVGTTDAKAIR